MAAAPTKKFTLTDLMTYTRVVAVVFIAGAIGLTLWQLVISLASNAVNNSRMAALSQPQPDYAFGRLPAISFPATLSRPTSYDLSLPGVSSDGTAGWPTFGNQRLISVYKLPPLTSSLSNDARARQIATSLSFSSEPTSQYGNSELFSFNSGNLQETLLFDLRTLFFTFRNNYFDLTGTVFALIGQDGTKLIPDQTEAITAVEETFLTPTGLWSTDLSKANATTTYVSALGGTLQPVRSFLEADYVTVSLPRTPLPGLVNGRETIYRFYSPNNIGSVYAVVGRQYDDTSIRGYRDIIVELQYYYSPFDLSNVGTYALRSLAEAWQSVLAGNAYVINPRSLPSVNITSVELGYYESHDGQEYLQPIYVFHGDGGVLIYTSALAANQLQ